MAAEPPRSARVQTWSGAMHSRLWPAVAVMAGCSHEPPPFVDLHGPPRWFRADVVHVVARGEALPGANLDGLSTQASGPSCRQDPRATSRALVLDGPDGVDSNFARVIVPRAIELCREGAGHQTLDRRTFFLRLDDLGGPNDSSVDGEVFPARWTGGRWLLDESFIVDGRSRIRLTGQSVDSVWSGRTEIAAPLPVPLALCGTRPRIAVRLRSASVVLAGGAGMLAGFLDSASMSQLWTDLRASPGFVASGICPGTASHDQAEIHLRVDPMDLVSSSPTLNSTEAACDAVSFGVEVEWRETEAPAIGASSEEPPASATCP